MPKFSDLRQRFKVTPYIDWSAMTPAERIEASAMAREEGWHHFGIMRIVGSNNRTSGYQYDPTKDQDND